MTIDRRITRRTLVGMGVGTLVGAALASCSSPQRFVTPTDAAVRSVEAARRVTGRIREVELAPAPAQVDLAGVTARTWSFGRTPASTIRVTAGDVLRATVRNDLPAQTSLHWHGVALRNDMDGVPGVTQKPISPGKEFRYEFVVPEPGTYWFHPHVGPQLDRGLYGALIVEDPREPMNYDDEWVVVLDDWLDGVSTTPDDVLKELRRGMMSGMGANTLMGADSELLGGDAGDVRYPYFLINGRPPADPEVFASAPGRRVRLRIVNAGGDTAFRVALGGHRLTITHSDGYPVDPVETDSLLVGMGERIDVLVTLSDGVFPLAALAEGKQQRAFALVRTAPVGEAPSPMIELPEFSRSVATSSGLKAAASAVLPRRMVDRELNVTLSGSMMSYDWAINGRRFDSADPLAGAIPVVQGERVRLRVKNASKMWHPFHLHGHTYQHSDGGARKDTSVVLPGATMTVEFDADNPGLWAAHCHNIYHAEAGMMTVFAYRS